MIWNFLFAVQCATPRRRAIIRNSFGGLAICSCLVFGLHQAQAQSTSGVVTASSNLATTSENIIPLRSFMLSQPEELALLSKGESSSVDGQEILPPPKGAAATKAADQIPPSERAPQTKRILGVIPNFRAISTDEKLPPQTVKDKFLTATQDSFDYSSIVVPALLAGYSLGVNSTPEFGHGAVGYGRYFWHAALDQTTENYMVEFFVPVATREDTRYYTLGRGSFMKRATYSVSRILITRSDSGREVVNLGEIVGAGASAGISSTYYPSRERTFTNTGTQWGLNLGVDAVADAAKEFWPDVNRWLTHAHRAANAQ